MRLYILVILIVILAGCSTIPPTSSVLVTDVAFADYWAQLKVREPIWFTSIGVSVPALPDATAVRTKVKFVEFEAEPGTTCYFDPGSWTIKIGSDKWASGCVPHELGHAALHFIKHPCASFFEHPDDVGKCIESSK